MDKTKRRKIGIGVLAGAGCALIGFLSYKLGEHVSICRFANGLERCCEVDPTLETHIVDTIEKYEDTLK